MSIKVGIVTPPDLSERLKKYDKKGLEEYIKNKLGKNITLFLKVDPIIGSSEDFKRAFDVLVSIKEKEAWDYVFSLSDLPQIENGKSVIYEYLSKHNIMLLFLPSLGISGTKKKLRYYLCVLLDENKEKKDIFYSHKGIGYVNLLVGMVMQNEPWKGISNFKSIISVAFATGTYISIFSMPWELSVIYSPWRLVLFMILSIIGMVAWLIYAHDLWEKISLYNENKYRVIYNLTTMITISILTLLSYIVIACLLVISIFLFVPLGLFNLLTSGEHSSDFINYTNLIWFTTSLALIAGALGSTVQDEERIKFIAYSYRQRYRYKMIKEKEDEGDDKE